MTHKTKVSLLRRLSRARRGAARAALLVALTTLLAACSDNPVGAHGWTQPPCFLPTTSVPAAALEEIASSTVRLAIVDAAGRIAGSLPAGPDADLLRSTVEFLSQHVQGGRAETGCRLLRLATDALERYSDDPATLPDRDALRLVLDLASAELASSTP